MRAKRATFIFKLRIIEKFARLSEKGNKDVDFQTLCFSLLSRDKMKRQNTLVVIHSHRGE